MVNVILALIKQLFTGGTNKAVVVAAGSLLNDVVTHHWTNTTAVIGYVLTILVWLIPNVEKAVSGDRPKPTTG